MDQAERKKNGWGKMQEEMRGAVASRGLSTDARTWRGEDRFPHRFWRHTLLTLS